MQKNVKEILRSKLNEQIMAGGLASKWAPRKGPIAVALRSAWNMAPKQYRKFLVANTKVVETLMCNKDWDSIEFDKLPSLAGLRYQTAFNRNASKRYEEYKAKLVKGEVKINVATLFPHNIVSNVRRSSGDALVLNKQWEALPDFLGANTGKVLVMSDVSGSMDCGIGGGSTCLDVSLALGIYTAERLKGPFKDLVLTFSESPQLHKLKGVSIADRINNLARVQWDMSTNLQAAFKLVLDTGLKNKVPQEDMPETIVVISDMEMNACTGNSFGKTVFGMIKTQYKEAGYSLPKLVFWNVNGRAGNNPVKHDEHGTAMVSGYSPSILTSVLTGEDFDPMTILLDTVLKERYDCADQIV